VVVSGDANVGAGHHWSRPLNCYTLADILLPITIDLFLNMRQFRHLLDYWDNKPSSQASIRAITAC
jgi:hypothetical protein